MTKLRITITDDQGVVLDSQEYEPEKLVNKACIKFLAPGHEDPTSDVDLEIGMVESMPETDYGQKVYGFIEDKE